MGADVTETEDGMIIHGGKPLHGAVIDSKKDHRIAMTFAVAALGASGETEILDADCVNISYPGFYGIWNDCVNKNVTIRRHIRDKKGQAKKLQIAFLPFSFVLLPIFRKIPIQHLSCDRRSDRTAGNRTLLPARRSPPSACPPERNRQTRNVSPYLSQTRRNRFFRPPYRMPRIAEPVPISTTWLMRCVRNCASFADIRVP